MNTHPLDPLNEQEIHTVTEIINREAKLDDSAWFETITLEEPGKVELSNFVAGQKIERRAYVCCYEPSSNRTFRGIVHINDETLESWNHIPGAQARIVTEEFVVGEKLVKADSGFRDA